MEGLLLLFDAHPQKKIKNSIQLMNTEKSSNLELVQQNLDAIVSEIQRFSITAEIKRFVPTDLLQQVEELKTEYQFIAKHSEKKIPLLSIVESAEQTTAQIAKSIAQLKANNPLFSDELVLTMNQIVSNANRLVKLCKINSECFYNQRVTSIIGIFFLWAKTIEKISWLDFNPFFPHF